MEVSRHALALCATAFLMSACAQEKSADTVFDDDYSSQSSCSGQKLDHQFIVHWEDGRFTVETAPNAEDFKKNFIEPQLSNIRRVTYDRMVHTQNDLSVSSASEVVNLDSSNWGLDMVEVEKVWQLGFQGQGVSVGVVDSPVDITHDALKNQILINRAEIPNNGIDDDNNGYIDDYSGYNFVPSNTNSHGTHVSGVIAGSNDAGVMKIGMAPKAKIIPTAFIETQSGQLGNAILAMQYAASRGAKIINASWGGAPCVSALRDAFSQLSQAGLLLVVASGNNSSDLDRFPSYPAAFNLAGQITVAAANAMDVMESFSNSGRQLVHIAAPGVNILSSVRNQQYETMSGTSMAAPFVSGAAAVLWSARPRANSTQIKQALLESAEFQTQREYRVQSRGRLNIYKAYQRLVQIVP